MKNWVVSSLSQISHEPMTQSPLDEWPLALPLMGGRVNSEVRFQKIDQFYDLQHSPELAVSVLHL